MEKQITDLPIPVVATLEKIERVNASIARHKNAPMPDVFAIEQWQEVKNDLVRQLKELLSECMDVEFPLATAA
ncbi:MAG: hypothetical protein ACKVUS_01705 [Saprospiraceae bacterium]